MSRLTTSLEHVDITELHRHLGATLIDHDRTRFCLWAPAHSQVEIELVDQQRRVPMQRGSRGFHFAEVDRVAAGDRYFYRPAGMSPRPDPVSRFQGAGVHGPSQVIDPNFAWTDHAWQPPPRSDLIIYELHLGALTTAGTYLAAIDRFDELIDLGITAIELMPLAQCPGKWNWGYDGVHWFAPNSVYGTPAQLRQMVDAAHAKGLAVILDVVYNHWGPEGNYLGDFGPYFSSRHATPWGAAPNFDDPEHGTEVRRYTIANAVYWLDEFHFDGLRVDAIHCMRDDRDPHVAAEISQAVRTWSQRTGRQAWLIAESNVYDPQMLATPQAGGMGFDAQWCDDLLHSVSAVVRPADQLCHRSYHSGTDLDQTLRMGFVYEGTVHDQRGRCPPGPRIDTRGLVYSIQQHDFVGNHPRGERFAQLTSIDAQRAAATLLLLSTGIPMVFMGEEFACDRPFRFFVDFGDAALREAVAEGRKQEYPQHDWEAGLLPTDPRIFAESKIGLREEGNLELWRWYQSLIAWRKRWQAEGLLRDASLTVATELGSGLYILRYDNVSQSILAAVRLTAAADSGEGDSGEGHESPRPPAMVTWRPEPARQGAWQLLLDSRAGQAKPECYLPCHAKVFVSHA